MSEAITYTISKPEPIKTMEFSLASKAFGRLHVTDDGKLEFEGDVDKSAKVFFDFLCANFPAFHEQAAQSELAALREELAGANRRLGACINQIEEQQQRLADAERRNAELTDLIEKAHTWVDRNNCGGWDAYELRDRLADALKPTESGASE